jgi:serine/threonine protein kinase
MALMDEAATNDASGRFGIIQVDNTTNHHVPRHSFAEVFCCGDKHHARSLWFGACAGAEAYTLGWLCLQSLGTGAFGSVHLIKCIHDNKLMALKRLKMRHVNKYLVAEIVNHSQLRHPHIIQFEMVFLSAGHVNIAMEYANGGTLFDHVRALKCLKESQARWFFQQLVLAVEFCHRKGTAVRDIKLENCLLHHEPGVPWPLLKICDFGYSKADYSGAAKSQVRERIDELGRVMMCTVCIAADVNTRYANVCLFESMLPHIMALVTCCVGGHSIIHGTRGHQISWHGVQCKTCRHLVGRSGAVHHAVWVSKLVLRLRHDDGGRSICNYTCKQTCKGQPRQLCSSQLWLLILGRKYPFSSDPDNDVEATDVNHR